MRTNRENIMEKMIEVLPKLEMSFSARQMRDVLVSHKVRYIGGISSIAFILKIHPSFKVDKNTRKSESNLYTYVGDGNE